MYDHTTQVTWNEAPEKPTDFKKSTNTHNAAIMYVLILCTLYKEHIINWTQKIRFVVVRAADLCLCWYKHYRFGPAITFSGVEWKQQLPLKSWGTSLSLQTRLSYTYSITHIHQQFIHKIRHYRNSTTDAIIRKRNDMLLTILIPQDTVTSTADSNIFFSFLSLRKAYVEESQKFPVAILTNISILQRLCVIWSHLGWKNKCIGFLEFRHVWRFSVYLGST